MTLDFKKIYLLALMAWLPLTMVMAAPPHPHVQELINQGILKLPDKIIPGLDGPRPVYSKSSGNSLSAQEGDFNILCILVDFSDNHSQTPESFFDTLIFDRSQGTVNDYYNEVSYGKINMTTINLPSSTHWLRAPQSYAYYVDKNYGIYSDYPHNSQKLCEDLVDMLDPVIDFSQYDNNHDGYVDGIIIIHAGSGAEFANGDSTLMWSHKWEIEPRLKDNVYITDYTVVPEYWRNPGDMTIGVICHELGHIFGLPDLYDLDNSSQGIGIWSLMSHGAWNGLLGDSPAHLDAWCKSKLGWVETIDVADTQTEISVPAAEYNPVVYRLWTNGKEGKEYFLVENRQLDGYDSALPGSGLLIWHIDENVTHNQYEWYPGHTAFGHLMVALEQADNLYHLERNASSGDAGDPYPGSSGNTSFTPSTEPSSQNYMRTGGYVYLTGISASDSIMTADLTVEIASGNEGSSLPMYELKQNYPNPFNPETTIAYSLSQEGPVVIRIYNILGELVKVLVNKIHSPGEYITTWDGTDDNGRTVASGIYLYELAANKSNTTRKMTFIK